MPPGSMMLLSHVRDTREMLSAREEYATATASLTPRGDNAIGEFFTGWELVDPGVARPHDWRPEGDEIRADHIACGVARKPKA